MISSFAKAKAAGPTEFHDNLINNPGRGIMWSRGVYNHFSFHNNHVKGRTTKTPRTEGLFGFNKNTEFGTIEIRNNIIELNGKARPLMRNDESYDAVIKNNKLINVSDTDAYANPDTGAPRGLREALQFRAGVNGEYTTDGWNAHSTDSRNRPK